LITALDTNVLLDILLPDPVFGVQSLEALQDAAVFGELVLCELVYAELAAKFAAATVLDSTRFPCLLSVRYHARLRL
jgi:hypothetical protein